MRLSGTYVERLIVCILPITFIVCLLIYLTKKTSPNIVVGLFFGITLLFWIIDTLVFYFRKPKRLEVKGDIVIGRQKVNVVDIMQIRLITYKPGRYWTWEFIEFVIKQGDSFQTVNVMQKPVTIIGTFQGVDSKTLSKLLNLHPELENKVVGKHLIHSFR